MPYSPGASVEVAELVLRAARTKAGDPKFMGSAAEAVRLAAIDLGANPRAAAHLMLRTRTMDRMLAKIRDEKPLHRMSFRKRMLADFDKAIDIAITPTFVKPSRMRRIGVPAATEAWNWAGLGEAQKEQNWQPIFARIVQEKRRASS